MRRVAAAGAKPLEWLPGARRAFDATLSRILDEDPATAELFRGRVERALDLIQAHPGLGTSAPKRNERRFAVPKTGHVFHYRVARNAIRIVLWYRARQDISR